jgi:hypothetical protein
MARGLTCHLYMLGWAGLSTEEIFYMCSVYYDYEHMIINMTMTRLVPLYKVHLPRL